MKYTFILALFLWTGGQVFAQQLTQIRGVVHASDSPISDAIVLINGKGKTMHLITDKEGKFHVKEFALTGDSLEVIVTRLGFRPYRGKFSASEISHPLRIGIAPDSTQQLQEVVITGSDVTNTAGKTIYNLNSKEYIINAKANVALQSLPGLSITGEGVVVDNQKRALIFIDGVESSIEELYRLNVSEISTVEVIANPSALYGTDHLGAVVQVNTKEKTSSFFKGELETFAGVRLGSRGITPTLSYKFKSLTFKTFYGYQTNNQFINTQTERQETDSYYTENNRRSIEGWQDYLSARMKIDVSDKAVWVLSGNMFRYHFDGLTRGSFGTENAVSGFTMRDEESLSKWFLSSVYSHQLSKRDRLLFKLKYFDYTNENASRFEEGNQEWLNSNAIASKTKEYSGEVVWEKDSLKLITKDARYTAGLKTIYRDFHFAPSAFALRQYVNTLFVDSDVTLSERLSLATSLSLDFTQNEGERVAQHYTYFLPTASFLYKFEKQYNLRANYGRRIIRPSANNLNTTPFNLNAGLALKGNNNLMPQLRDLYELSLSKTLKGGKSVSLRFFSEHIDNAIVESYYREGETFYMTYENAANSRVTGGSVGFNGRFLNALRVNLTSGLHYSSYTNDAASALVKATQGITFNNNFYINALLKQKVSFSFYGSFASPRYTMIARTLQQPRLNLEAESTFFKNKLNVRLTYMDIGALHANTVNKVRSEQLRQVIRTRNNTSNISLTLTYNFGKVFNDRFQNQMISNDDMILK